VNATPSLKTNALIASLQRSLTNRLTEGIAQSFERSITTLAARSAIAETGEEKSLLALAADFAHRHQHDMTLRFRNHFEQALTAAFETPAPAENGSEKVDFNSLTLVSDDLIDQSMERSRWAQRTAIGVDQEILEEFKTRLRALLDNPSLGSDQLPASLASIYDALKAALPDGNTPPQTIKAALAAVGANLSSAINDACAAANAQLRESGVLPDFVPGALIRESRRQTSGNVRVSPQRHSDLMGIADLPDADMSDDDQMLILQHAMAQAYSGQGQGEARRKVAKMLANPAAIDRLSGVLPSIEERSALMSSLTSFQRSEHSFSQGGIHPDLLARIKDEGTPLDQITVDIVGVVFDYIYQDPRLPDSIKQQLLRMQVIAVKAALLSRGFFARRQHPLRQLIDRIAEAGSDPDSDVSEGSDLMVGLRRIVDHVIVSFDTDVEVFVQATQSIDELIKQQSDTHRARLAATERAIALREAQTAAQDEARAELELMTNAQTPAFVKALLNEWWAIFVASSRATPDFNDSKAAWKKGIDTAKLLCWSTCQKDAQDIVSLAEVLPGLIRDLRAGLASVDMPQVDQNRFFQSLMLKHTQEIAAAKTRPAFSATIPSTTIETSALRKRADALPAALAPEGVVPFAQSLRRELPTRPIDASLASIQRGQMIEINRDGDFRVYKLAWISPARKVYIFSRHPEETLTYEDTDLAGLILSGQARPSSESSPLDRAIALAAGVTTAE
jgi:Protein of unknown function (DUF1631)